MKPLRRIWCRLLGTFRQDPRDAELASEIDGHLRLMIEDNQRLGMTADDARRAAVLQFGNARALEETCRDHRGFPLLEAFFRDVSYAIRMLRNSPGFALTAIGSIALGIAANSQVFSLAEAVVLRPLSVPKPSQVVSLASFLRGDKPFDGGSSSGLLSYPDFLDFRHKSKSFKGMAAWEDAGFGFAADKQNQPVSKYGLLVSGNFFEVLDIRLPLGRGFRPSENEVPGRDAVAVISHDLWADQFASQPDAIGKTVFLGGLAFTVIGVTPERFAGPDQFAHPEVYIPAMMQPRLAADAQHNVLEQRGARIFHVKGRLKRGVSVSSAAAEAKVISGELAQAYPDTNRNYTATITTELELRYAQDPYTPMLLGFMLLLAGAVLLIACANVANLMLSRARARAREIAVRLAIGAGRGRLVRQLLTESLVIAVLGGALGLAAAKYVSSALSPIILPFETPIVLDLNLDSHVLLFALIATFASTIFFGLVPALQATRPNLIGELKSSGRKNGKGGHLIGKNASVIAQVAASLLLLVVAAQALRGTLIVLASPAGFRTDHLLMASFDPSLVRYTPAGTQEFYDRLVEAARRLPGVKAAALTQTVPMSPQVPITNVPEGFQLPPGLEALTIPGATVGDGYFETLGIPIVRGRGFLQTDKPGSPPVAVVNESFAGKYFPNQDPVGKRLRLGAAQMLSLFGQNQGNGSRAGSQVEIVGVAKQSKYIFIAEPPTSMIYLPLRQNPETHMTLLLGSNGQSADLARPLRDLVRSLDPGQPLIAVRTIEGYFDQRVVKMMGLLTGTIAAMSLLGLVLAVIGLYGLMAWSVARRTREIGIRIAVGARRRDVLTMVFRHGIVLVAVGTVIGLLLSLLVSRAVTAAFSVPPFNVTLLVLVPLGLLAVTALGAYVPARRASLLDPNLVLRQD